MRAKTLGDGRPITTAAVRAPAAPAAGERDWSQIALNVYLAIFFVYLFAPLLVMSLAAFNAYQYPSVTQWQGWTLKWFAALADDTRMWQGVIHSLVIATGVILISLPLGLAGALILTRLQSRWNGVLYGIMVSPVLTPGIILGISTLIFWQNFSVGGGKWVATVAQSTLHRVLLDADVHGPAAAPGPLARGGGARSRRLADAWCSAGSRCRSSRRPSSPRR